MLEHTSADTQAAAAAAATLHLRITIVGATVDVLRDVPFHEAHVGMVAERMGITTEELRQHFPSWDGLVLAAVDRWNGARLEAVAHEVGDGPTVDLLRAIVASNAEDPALMRLLVALLSVAGNPAHPMATYLRSRYQLFFSQVRRGLEHDIAVGRAPHTMDPRRGAEQLIALYEGSSCRRCSARSSTWCRRSTVRSPDSSADGWSGTSRRPRSASRRGATAGAGRSDPWPRGASPGSTRSRTGVVVEAPTEGTDMAAPNPIQVQKYLSGIDYPASKEDIVATAEKEDAPGDVLDALKGIPDGDYDAPTAVTKAVSDKG